MVEKDPQRKAGCFKGLVIGSRESPHSPNDLYNATIRGVARISGRGVLKNIFRCCWLGRVRIHEWVGSLLSAALALQDSCTNDLVGRGGVLCSRCLLTIHDILLPTQRGVFEPPEPPPPPPPPTMPLTIYHH